MVPRRDLGAAGPAQNATSVGPSLVTDGGCILYQENQKQKTPLAGSSPQFVMPAHALAAARPSCLFGIRPLLQRGVGKSRSVMLLVTVCPPTPEPLSWIAIRRPGLRETLARLRANIPGGLCSLQLSESHVREVSLLIRPVPIAEVPGTGAQFEKAPSCQEMSSYFTLPLVSAARARQCCNGCERVLTAER